MSQTWYRILSFVSFNCIQRTESFLLIVALENPCNCGGTVKCLISKRFDKGVMKLNSTRNTIEIPTRIQNIRHLLKFIFFCERVQLHNMMSLQLPGEISCRARV